MKLWVLKAPPFLGPLLKRIFPSRKRPQKPR